MKFVLALAVAAGALWTASPTPAAAQADPYPWCAEMGGGDDGGMVNCYFMTLAQCQATVSGVGGFCRRNHFYTGPNTGYDELPPRRTEKRRTTR